MPSIFVGVPSASGRLEVREEGRSAAPWGGAILTQERQGHPRPWGTNCAVPREGPRTAQEGRKPVKSNAAALREADEPAQRRRELSEALGTHATASGEGCVTTQECLQVLVGSPAGKAVKMEAEQGKERPIEKDNEMPDSSLGAKGTDEVEKLQEMRTSVADLPDTPLGGGAKGEVEKVQGTRSLVADLPDTPLGGEATGKVEKAQERRNGSTKMSDTPLGAEEAGNAEAAQEKRNRAAGRASPLSIFCLSALETGKVQKARERRTLAADSVGAEKAQGRGTSTADLVGPLSKSSLEPEGKVKVDEAVQKSRTSTADFPDTLLGAVLESRTSIADLPDTLLGAVLESVARKGAEAGKEGAYDYALVSRAWYGAFCRQQSLSVLPPTPLVKDRTVLRQLAASKDLTSLHFCSGSVSSFHDLFINELATSLGKQLVHLTFDRDAAHHFPYVCCGLEALSLHAPKLKTLVLPHSPASDDTRGYVVPEGISRLVSLERLEVGNCLELPPNFGHNLKSLKSLRLTANTLLELPETLTTLTSLRSLYLCCRDLEALPKGFSALTGLRALWIVSPSLQELPPDCFQGMAHLQVLSVCAVGVRALPPSTAALVRLRQLKLTIDLSRHGLPPCVPRMGASLERLELGMGLRFLCETSLASLPNLRSLLLFPLDTDPGLPDSLASASLLSSLTLLDDHAQPRVRCLAHPLVSCGPLRRLHLDCFPLVPTIPSAALAALASLHSLVLSDFPLLKDLPLSLGSLAELTSLRVLGCPGLRDLPATLGDLQHLQLLELEGCDGVQCLPPGVGRLQSLRSLYLRSLAAFEYLTEEFALLRALEVVTLQRLPRLKRVPSSAGETLACLRRLDLLECAALATLPCSVAGMHQLAELTAYACPELRSLPQDLGSVASLRVLRVLCCEKLQYIPTSLGRLPSLRQLHLDSLPSLICLPESLSLLTGLRGLSLEDCPGLSHLPANLSCLGELSMMSRSRLALLRERLAGLRELEVSGQEFLPQLPHDFFRRLDRLEALAIRGCPHLEELPPSLLSLPRLTSLTLAWCHRLPALPPGLGSLLSLTELVLCGLDSLEELPDSLGDLQNLEVLSITHCASLSQLPEPLGSLLPLGRLEVKHCAALAALPDSLGQLPWLRQLSLEGLPRLEALPEALGGLENLLELRVCRCARLRGIPKSAEQLLRLEELAIESCPSLGPLPKGLESLPKLSAASKQLVWGLRQNLVPSRPLLEDALDDDM